MLGALGAPSVAAAGAKGKAGPVKKPKKNPKDAKAGKGERKTRSRLACLPCKSTSGSSFMGSAWDLGGGRGTRGMDWREERAKELSTGRGGESLLTRRPCCID